MADPNAIDPAKLPDGAIKQLNGTIWYKESIYDEKGKRTGSLEDAQNQAIADPIGAGANPLALFGISAEDTKDIITRAGIILLGAVLGIVGISFVISGTKTAALVKSAIPVAGKVL